MQQICSTLALKFIIHQPHFQFRLCLKKLSFLQHFDTKVHLDNVLSSVLRSVLQFRPQGDVMCLSRWHLAMKNTLQVHSRMLNLSWSMKGGGYMRPKIPNLVKFAVFAMQMWYNSPIDINFSIDKRAAGSVFSRNFPWSSDQSWTCVWQRQKLV